MNWITKLFKGGAEKSADSVFVPFGVGANEVQRVDKSNLIANNKNWVFICTDFIAKAVSGVELRLMKYSNSGDDVEVLDHPVLDFLKKPNPQLNDTDFIYSHTASKKITGNAYWKIDRSGAKVTLTPLVATRIETVLDKQTGEVVQYKYRQGAKVHTYDVSEVLHDKTPNPYNIHTGMSTLEGVADWIDIDAFAQQFHRRFFTNGATFGGFIETEEETEERVTLIKLGLATEHQGVDNAHKLGVLPKGAKFKGRDVSMSDMQFQEGDVRNRDKILTAFGIPKAVLGIVEDVNRANAEASEYVFSKYTLKPEMRSLCSFLNDSILPLFTKDDTLYFTFEEVVPDNEELKLKQAEVALNKAPYMTINEVRAEQGLPPIENGDVVQGNPMTVPVGSPQQRTVKKPLTKGQKREKQLEEIAEKITDITLKTFGEDVAVKKKVNKSVESEDELEVEHKAFVARVTEYEKQLRDKLIEYNQRVQNDVIRNLGTLITKAVSEKKISKQDIYDQESEVAVMVDFAKPILKLLAIEEADLVFAELVEGEVFDTDDERLAKEVNDTSLAMAQSYTNTTAEKLTIELNQGLADGDSLVELTERVQNVMDFRTAVGAVQTAQTEAFHIANEASNVAYIQSGVVKSKKWYTAQDERVCEFCGPMHEKTVEVTKSFFKKGEKVEGRDGGELFTDYRSVEHPPLHPSCRCQIKPDRIEIE